MSDEPHKDNQDREDHYQVVASQKMIRGMREEVTNLGVMVKEVRDALKGSDLAKDGGLVGRVEYLEQTFQSIQKQIDHIKINQLDARKVWKWVYVSLGVIATTLFTWALNHFFPPVIKK